MATATAPPTEAPPQRCLTPDNDVITLHGVSWEEYRRLREDPANEGVRMYFSGGALLTMTTGNLHERLSHLLGLFLTVWTRQSGIPLMCFGRWTLQTGTAQQGLEADNCYYVHDLPDVRQQRPLSLDSDPSPHLAIEVDITTDSSLKFGIYAALGVAEVWVWQGTSIQVHRLTDGSYETTERSELLPGFPSKLAAELVITHYASDDGTVLDAFLDAV